ncbi:DUF6362 family protein [Alphaproteobacteria bacterium LSUCC0719]
MTDIEMDRAPGPTEAATSPTDGRTDSRRLTGDVATTGGPQASRAMALRLVRAVDTLDRLPMKADTRPAGTRSAWPEMIRKSRFAIEATRRTMPARPTPTAIDDLDRLAMLMWQLPAYQRQLLWARACGVRWAELCHRYRRSRTTLNRDHRRALLALVLAEDAAPDQESA